MKKHTARLISFIGLLFIPSFLFAQTNTDQGPLPVPPWQIQTEQNIDNNNNFFNDTNDPDQGNESAPYYRDGGGDWGTNDDYIKEKYLGGTRTCNAPKFKGQFGLFAYKVVCVIEIYIIPIFLLVGFVIFLWSGSQFIRNAANEEMRDKYKHALIWGIVVIFVMLSFWGIILLARNTIGI